MELLLNIVQQKIVIEIFCNLCPHLSSPFSSWLKNMFKEKCPCYIVWQNYAYRNSLSNSTAFVLIRMFLTLSTFFARSRLFPKNFFFALFFINLYFIQYSKTNVHLFWMLKPSIKMYSLTHPPIDNLLHYTSLGVKEKIFES